MWNKKRIYAILAFVLLRFVVYSVRENGESVNECGENGNWKMENGGAFGRWPWAAAFRILLRPA
jgi:hypothetical protein